MHQCRRTGHMQLSSLVNRGGHGMPAWSRPARAAQRSRIAGTHSAAAAPAGPPGPRTQWPAEQKGGVCADVLM